jgi:hypothetical protein
VIQQRILAPSRSQVHPVITAGVLVGILDILAAFIVRYWFTRASPVRVLQGIASGLLGPAAFTGGAATAVLGMFLHLAIAFAVAGVYYAASRRWRILVQHPIVSGVLYGVAVHWVMNQIVLPLSRLPIGPRTPPLSFTLAMVVVHMLFVGLPIALTVAGRDRADERRWREKEIRPQGDTLWCMGTIRSGSNWSVERSNVLRELQVVAPSPSAVADRRPLGQFQSGAAFGWHAQAGDRVADSSVERLQSDL